MTNTTNEEWRPIRDWPDYEVSSRGRVRRCTTGNGAVLGRVLRLRVTATGYLSVTLSRDGQPGTVKVHRLVLSAFIGTPPTVRHHANHKNFDRKDNRRENLEWVTARRNNEYTIAAGRHAHGERHGKTTLAVHQVLAIRALASSGTALSEVSRRFGVPHSTVSNIHHRRTWAWLQEAS